MKKNLPIHEIESFNWPSKENYLRRDYKLGLSRAKREAIQFTIIGLFVLVALVLFACSAFSAMTARAQSVLLYDDVRVEKIYQECEDKVRELSYDR